MVKQKKVMQLKKLIVISPHPDDECLGVGGTILKKKKDGYKIINIIITSLKHSKNSKTAKDKQLKEIYECQKILKIDKTYILDFLPTTLKTISLKKIIDKISKIFLKERPQEVYLPFINDAHDDHFIAHKAGLACSKWFRNNFINSVFAYETLSETHLANIKKKENIFFPNYYVDITKHIDRKLKALKSYKSQIKKHPFPRSIKAAKSLAVFRGSSCGFKYAESFEVLIIRKK